MSAIHSITLPEGSRFKVLASEYRSVGRRTRLWLKCQCACGNVGWRVAYSVLSGNAKSCGCLHRERCARHGLWRLRAYKVWGSIVQRCRNEKDKEFNNYGGRGIQLHPAWFDFVVFYEALKGLGLDEQGDIPFGLTVDRTENDRGYEPGNIRLVPRAVQNRNRRGNRFITIGGVTKCVADWALEAGLSVATVNGRLFRGWDEIRAVTIPVGGKKNDPIPLGGLQSRIRPME